MKRVELDIPHQVPHFIGSWFIEPPSLCDELIDFFESWQEEQTDGKTGGGLNPESKESTDLTIRPRDLSQPGHDAVKRYIEALFECHNDYLEQWPFLQDVLARVDLCSFNIQRYRPGGHFRKLHSERTSVGTSHRVLAWMTYLNDVAEGGSTYFAHQQLEIQPAKGKTLIWPAEWTHAHQGNVVQAGTKYIITGWMHFPSTSNRTENSGLASEGP